ncbi:MAG TPA: hypothetical protein VN253_08220 [Kofleriaceae bacterium]|nr:hypothetical protein [Kofleriaceae bacterium]
MISTQARRIRAVLDRPDRNDAVAAWLAQLEEALVAEIALDDETIGMLVSDGRPHWGVRTPEDARAYIDFWSRLVTQHDDPRLQAACADVIYLLGGASRACEALAMFVTAVERRPELFVEYAGDFSEVAKQCGRSQQLDFELAKVRFFAALVDRGELEESDLRDAVREILATYDGEPSLRNRLTMIARGS